MRINCTITRNVYLICIHTFYTCIWTPAFRKQLFVCLSDSSVCVHSFNNEIKLPAGPGGCAVRAVILAVRDLTDHPLGTGWCCAYEWRSEVGGLLPPAHLLLECHLTVSNGDRMKIRLINPTKSNKQKITMNAAERPRWQTGLEF